MQLLVGTHMCSSDAGILVHHCVVCLQVTLRLEVLPATCPAAPAIPNTTTTAAAIAAAASAPLPASTLQPATAAVSTELDAPAAAGSDQEACSPAAITAAAATASLDMDTGTTLAPATAAAEAGTRGSKGAHEPQQQWLGIRRTLRGDTSKTHIKRPDSSSWTPVNQVSRTSFMPLFFFGCSGSCVSAPMQSVKVSSQQIKQE
jgi:hypothetical protein